jgi:hypothetical protein
MALKARRLGQVPPWVGERWWALLPGRRHRRQLQQGQGLLPEEPKATTDFGKSEAY